MEAKIFRELPPQQYLKKIHVYRQKMKKTRGLKSEETEG
jgi:hypothetical protein